MKLNFQSLLPPFVIYVLLYHTRCTDVNYNDETEGLLLNEKKQQATILNLHPKNSSNSGLDLKSSANVLLQTENLQAPREPIKTANHFLKPFQPITLKFNVKRASHEPVCVLYTNNNESSLDFEKKIYKFWKTLENDFHCRTWQIGFIDTTRQDLSSITLPQSLPTLTCYIGTASPHDYHGKGTKKHLHKWFNKLYLLHLERLPEARRSTIDDVIKTANITLLAFPGTVHHYDVEMILIVLSDIYKSSVNFLMVHSGSVDEESLKRRFNVEKDPAVIAFNGSGWTKGSTKTLARFTDGQVTQNNLESFLVTQTSTSTVLNLNNFREEVLEGVKIKQAILVCLHAPWGVDNTHYLDVFHRSQQTFENLNIDLRFGLVDLTTDAEVVYRYVDATYAKSVPFTMLFWYPKKQQHKAKRTIHQAVLQSGLPSSWNIATFIKQQELPLTDKSGNELQLLVFSEISDVKFGVWQPNEMCSTYANFTQPITVLRDADPKPDLKNVKMNKVNKQKKLVKRIGSLNQITAANWHSLIETSDSPLDLQRPFSSGIRKEQSIFVKVSVVVFIRDKCSNCARKLKVFERVKKAAEFIEGASVYMMNCSEDVKLCDRLKIRGFPTVSAFRSIKENAVENCLSKNRDNLVRVDYHGYIEEKEIMEWLSRVSIPVTELSDWTKLDDSKIDNQDEEVRVLATVLPRRLAYHYLRSASGHTSWLPYQCFAVACERLFGVAKCYGAISKNIPDRDLKDKEDDLVVSQIMMQRKDGVEALIMRANTPLFLTLKDDSTKKLHKFHTPHRYNIRNNQRCEDDHAQCTEVISLFIRDHSRLPVTHLTMDTFHTSTGFAVDHDNEGSVFSSGQPVLIALVHRENISSHSVFLESLTDVAYTFYNKIVITTLLVEEFPQWATRFVPYGYHRHIFEHAAELTEHIVPSLHIYPRLCIVRGNDHQRAAFYPHSSQFLMQSKELGRVITVKEIKSFVKEFIDDPESMMVKTEHF
ncbi:uncharacterized protein [Antedon mediterranea]|uniref:uncharacterized protein n=1 Tax=Antedon mediterranea TaxID=105859 RepID=UPI003AF5FFEE